MTVYDFAGNVTSGPHPSNVQQDAERTFGYNCTTAAGNHCDAREKLGTERESVVNI